jgi:hypothetical protein
MQCNLTEFACAVLHHYLQISKRAQITCGTFAKGAGYPFDPFAFGNRKLHATPSMSAMYCWDNFILNK